MNGWTQLWTKISLAARAVFLDLFAEGASEVGTHLGSLPNPTDSGPADLEQIQVRLDGLAGELAVLIAGQKQLETQQRCAEEALAALDAQIDIATPIDEDRTRSLLQQRKEIAQRLEALTARCVEQAQVVAETRASLERLSGRLKDARRQQTDLAVREQSASALEQLAQVNRELERDLENLQAGVARRAEQAARAEDRAAAWNELNRRDHP